MRNRLYDVHKWHHVKIEQIVLRISFWSENCTKATEKNCNATVLKYSVASTFSPWYGANVRPQFKFFLQSTPMASPRIMSSVMYLFKVSMIHWKKHWMCLLHISHMWYKHTLRAFLHTNWLAHTFHKWAHAAESLFTQGHNDNDHDNKKTSTCSSYWFINPAPHVSHLSRSAWIELVMSPFLLMTSLCVCCSLILRLFLPTLIMWRWLHSAASALWRRRVHTSCRVILKKSHLEEMKIPSVLLS